MSHEAPEGWVERRVRAAMKGEIGALRAALAEAVETARAESAAHGEAIQAVRAEFADQTAELRAMIRTIGVEVNKTAVNANDGLNTLRAAMEGDERIETLRLRVEGLLAQHRWDADQLRQALAALAERLPLSA